MAKANWVEREEGDKTIRSTTYEGSRIEVTAVLSGSEGHFAATYYRVDRFGSGKRYTSPEWGATAHEALDRACRSAVQQVDADRFE